jgi:hypothetical protein
VLLAVSPSPSVKHPCQDQPPSALCQHPPDAEPDAGPKALSSHPSPSVEPRGLLGGEPLARKVLKGPSAAVPSALPEPQGPAGVVPQEPLVLEGAARLPPSARVGPRAAAHSVAAPPQAPVTCSLSEQAAAVGLKGVESVPLPALERLKARASQVPSPHEAEWLPLQDAHVG